MRWHFNLPFCLTFRWGTRNYDQIGKTIFAILGNANVNDEELMTAIIGAEALIYSRSLTYQSANPSDDVPLSPNHLLHGQLGGQFAPTSVGKRI